MSEASGFGNLGLAAVEIALEESFGNREFHAQKALFSIGVLDFSSFLAVDVAWTSLLVIESPWNSPNDLWRSESHIVHNSKLTVM